MNKIEKSLTFTEAELQQNLKVQFDFLSLIHPFATVEGYKKGRLEVRTLHRHTTKKSSGNWSFTTWELTEESASFLMEKMVKENGTPICSYYSGFAFDPKVLTDKGQTPNKINKENALFSQILPADFDNLIEEEFNFYKNIFLNLGIETLDVFTGHGYQLAVLLDEKSFNKNLFADFTALLLRKGFPVDERIEDISRLLRMPNSLNCKAFQVGDKYFNLANPEPIQTSVYNWTGKRYSLDWVFQQLETMPDVKQPKKENKSLEPVKAPSKTKEEQEAIFDEVFGAAKPQVKEAKAKPQEQGITVENVANLYKHFDFNELPVFIQNVLKGTPDSGVGNDSLLFIIPYLKNTLGLSLTQQIETMKVWGSLCTPQWLEDEISDETKRLNTDYKIKAGHGTITKKMVEVFGNFIKDDIQFTKDNELIINNDFFENMADFSNGSIKLYLCTKYMQHYYKEEQLNNFSEAEIKEFWDISDKTFQRHAKTATQEELITKNKSVSNKRKGKGFSYYPNPFTGNKKRLVGYTVVPVATVEKLINSKFTGSEVKLYLYLSYLVNNRGKEVSLSIRKLGKAIGVKHQTISQLTEKLEKKRFIKKLELENEDKTISLKYRLLN